ncbi:hypothetical protein [Blastopirellula marina]|uniref:Uncharacterized protein n=1 Tax=Blastopirellula marina DSM 3645 TaxID=314230 RepID=A3ZSE6_9BACT|nr:hypothetical protein [Blastopirellula marina]EAQ80606.1 hypothetical protein DSM3645_14710 [Blastopirellula marina DSM 3645]
MEFLLVILASTTCVTAILAAIGYIFRATLGEWLIGSIRQMYAKELESHKSDLRTESETTLAHLKSSLQTDGEIALERLKAALGADAAIAQIRFSTQYEKAAEAIVKTHHSLDAAFNAVAAYTAILETPSMGSKEERRNAVNDTIMELRSVYRERRIYLPTALAKRVKNVEKQLFDTANSFSMKVEHGRSEVESTKEWTATYNRMKDEILPIMESLENLFRDMLGINQMFADVTTSDNNVVQRSTA